MLVIIWGQTYKIFLALLWWVIILFLIWAILA